MIFYGIGVVSYHLIRLNQDEIGEQKNLSKLNILQGGVEPRFIPSLSAETKRQIEGSFKITNDQELRELAMKDENDVNLEPSDKLFIEILDSTQSSQKVQTVIDLLQQYLRTKKPICVFASVGAEQGMRLTRAAFAVILKFSDSLGPFEDLIREVDKIMSDLAAKDASLTEAQRMNSTIQLLQEQESSYAYLSILKKWEQAAQMRKWTQ